MNASPGGGGGGATEVHILYPKKSLGPFFLQLKKIPLFFFANQKNPGVFHRPQKITFGQNFRPKKITRTPLSLKYVSGAPRTHLLTLIG